MRQRVLLDVLALAQVMAAARVMTRFLATARGEQIAHHVAPLPGERVTVIVPVLNERHRLAPCLEGLIAQPEEAVEILVVDGGSDDGTTSLVADYQRRDRRVKLITAAPIPAAWNGKTHGLQVGLDHADPASAWILTIDADVRPGVDLTRSLLAHARRTGDAAISLATRQRVSGLAEGLVHPALLTTLVYRFGIPGRSTRRVQEVQANGQCCLLRRRSLQQIGGFSIARSSLCEDVTVCRALVAAGESTGFHEGAGLAETSMYEGWRDAWRNWPRSLPMRDRYVGIGAWRGLGEVTLAQALPLPLLVLLRRARTDSAWLLAVNFALLMMRLGVLVGTARAYVDPPWTYWLSPAVDLPVTVQLWRSALRRHHRWRGRMIVRDDTREAA